MTNLKWYLKQLLPLTYRSHYKLNDNKVFTVWRMWMGRCFSIETVDLK